MDAAASARFKDVGDDAGVHEQALRELERHSASTRLAQPPHGLVYLQARGTARERLNKEAAENQKK